MAYSHFSVTQYFDNFSETVRTGVEMKQALAAFAHYTGNVAAGIGLVKKVTVTDGDGKIVLEWRYGRGIVFPPP